MVYVSQHASRKYGTNIVSTVFVIFVQFTDLFFSL